jgi:acyl-CoA synthetase (AMP-forming)/AMP-acid ligase II
MNRHCHENLSPSFTAVNWDVQIWRELGLLQIYVRGPALAIGYLKLPELNAERFVNCPGLGRLFRTRDWGYILSDGNLKIGGRCGSTVMIQGYSIETQVCFCEVLVGVVYLMTLSTA